MPRLSKERASPCACRFNMTTYHATAVLVGRKAILIRGPSGSGKSWLAHDILVSPQAYGQPFARLIADDRVILTAMHGRLIASCPQTIRDLIEVRGLGPVPVASENEGVVALIVDLGASDAERVLPNPLPECILEGVQLPRIPLSNGWGAVGALRKLLQSG